MAIRTSEEILKAVSGAFGEDSSDETIALVEDITDTLADLEKKANNDNENWKKKYEDNDAAWRKKYRDRFFSAGSGDDGGEPDPDPAPKKLTFESLFKEG